MTKGLFAKELGQHQARRRRSSTPAPTRSRRCSPARSTPPTSAPARRSTPTGRATATRSASSPAPRPAARELVVRDGINTAADLKGKKLATPQLGNTQDVALRTWLTDQGLKNSVTGGGDVTIAPTANSDVLNLFKAGKLDGAWVPEPYASRLVLEGGGHVLVDEKDLWPGGQVRHHAPDRPHRVPEEVPGRPSPRCCAGTSPRCSSRSSDAAAAKTAVNAGLTAAGGKAARRPTCSTAPGAS